MNGVAMNIFSIDSDNNITVHAGLPASADNMQSFSTAKELAKLAADWPVTRLVETWNSFAGVAPFDDLKPVKKFASRKGALTRIWAAVQRLCADVTKHAAHVAPAKAKGKKGARKGKRRHTARTGAKRGANTAREGSKKAEIIDLIRRPGGATLAEIMEVTSWQAHTVRGFVSGTLTKKLGLRVESFRTEERSALTKSDRSFSIDCPYLPRRRVQPGGASRLGGCATPQTSPRAPGTNRQHPDFPPGSPLQSRRFRVGIVPFRQGPRSVLPGAVRMSGRPLQAWLADP
jgi:hypothetical protein